MTIVGGSFESPVGDLRVFATADGVTGVYFPGQDVVGASGPNCYSALHQLERGIAWLTRYFEGDREQDLPSVHFSHGTDFQKEVWEALRTIPMGETVTYGSIAEKIARPKAVRAVGAAIGRNPISIVVPCHRVIGGSGKLTGFAGGLDRKRWLLGHERVDGLL